MELEGIDNKRLLFLYNQYLVQIAYRESRPFYTTRDIENLFRRDDYKLFIGLYRKLQNDGIVRFRDIRFFMKSAEEAVIGPFHVSDIIKEYEYAIGHYNKRKKEIDIDDREERIKKSFSFLEEMCLMGGLKYDDLFKGSPSVILKKWKEGSVDKIVVVYLCDFNEIKKKNWSFIYCGNLINEAKKISKDINNSVYLTSLLEDELLKLKSSI